MMLLAGIPVWRHQHKIFLWNFEVLVSNSGYVPGRLWLKDAADDRSKIDANIKNLDKGKKRIEKVFKIT